MHYNTFPVIEQNGNFFSNQLLNYPEIDIGEIRAVDYDYTAYKGK